MITSIYAEKMIPYYDIVIEKLAINVWYAPKVDYYCVFKGSELTNNNSSIKTICYFDDYKSNTPLIEADKYGLKDSFILLCFLAQKDNCKAPDIMLWLSGVNSKEEYIERAKDIDKALNYQFPCSVAFEGDDKEQKYFGGQTKGIFGEDICVEDYAPTVVVRNRGSYYECYTYIHRYKQETVEATIYDEALLYSYLLNSQFNLLLNRAEDKL